MAEQPAAMRVLIATDGSECADVAVEQARSIDWPAGSTLRVVSVVEPARAIVSSAWAPAVAQDLERQLEEALRAAQAAGDTAAERLARQGINVEAAVLEGRAASSITDDAATFGAQLVIVGSRGRGTISTMVLGSTSAEVADHAPCPVLVARRKGLSKVILATDGSAPARAAEAIIEEWPIFEATPLEVVSVADASVPWTAGLALSAAPEAVGDDFAESLKALVEMHSRVAEDAAGRLSRAGRRATPRVLQGDPASEIVRVASDDDVDLVVIATHGRSGLERLLLGSVARNVMLHAPCSVLVTRERASLT